MLNSLGILVLDYWNIQYETWTSLSCLAEGSSRRCWLADGAVASSTTEPHTWDQSPEFFYTII